MITAHRRGVCVVAVFTRDVAETKATRATDAGRRKGYPLLFTTGRRNSSLPSPNSLGVFGARPHRLRHAKRRDVMNPSGQVAIVTGGGSGLGEATARALAARGAKVALLDVGLARAEQVAAELGGIALKCDVSSADDAERPSPRRPDSSANRASWSTAPASRSR